MDDSIRPSQAAKRRSAHGEKQLSPHDSLGALSDRSDTDGDMPVLTDNESEIEDNPKQVPRNKKGQKAQPSSSAGTRRSLRTVSCPRKSYNMKIHPQDEELQILSDDETIMRVPRRKRKRQSSVVPTIEVNSDNDTSNDLENKRHNPAFVCDSEDSDGIVVEFESPPSIEPTLVETHQGSFPKTLSIRTSIETGYI